VRALGLGGLFVGPVTVRSRRAQTRVPSSTRNDVDKWPRGRSVTAGRCDRPKFPHTAIGVTTKRGREIAPPVASRKQRRVQGDLEAVKDSLRHHGPYRTVVANRRTGEVLAGNNVFRAARELGFEEIAATIVDLRRRGDPARARRQPDLGPRTTNASGGLATSTGTHDLRRAHPRHRVFLSLGRVR
jgi:hypothetical protein